MLDDKSYVAVVTTVPDLFNKVIVIRREREKTRVQSPTVESHGTGENRYNYTVHRGVLFNFFQLGYTRVIFENKTNHDISCCRNPTLFMARAVREKTNGKPLKRDLSE